MRVSTRAQFSILASLSLVFAVRPGNGLRRSRCCPVTGLTVNRGCPPRLVTPWEPGFDVLRRSETLPDKTWLSVRTSRTSWSSFSDSACQTRFDEARSGCVERVQPHQNSTRGVTCIRAQEVSTASFEASSPPRQERREWTVHETRTSSP